jgi:NAD-dependent dihydropyrimidine dehydrogenase PreA subunit
MAYRSRVNEKKCLGCEECVEICSVDVFEMRCGKAFAVNAEKCVGCRSCVQACPEDAITVEDLRVSLSSQCSFLLRDILD